MIKHLLSMDQLSSEDITTILDTAESLRQVTDRPIKKLPTLRGRTVCNLFYEASTRTRISFELAAKRLSADVINFSADSKSSVAKGESFKDTAWTLEAMGVDAIIVRHSSSGAPHQLSKWVKASVLNAGDGQHEHPTQALLDLFSIRERFKDFEGLQVAIVGDVLHSRVARSNVKGLVTMGAEVILVGPPTLIPPQATEWGATINYSTSTTSSPTSTSATCCECRRSDSPSSCSRAARVRGPLGARFQACGQDASRRADHASRADEPGRRDLGRRLRVGPGDHPRPGDERPGGADEPAVPDARWPRDEPVVDVPNEATV